MTTDPRSQRAGTPVAPVTPLDPRALIDLSHMATAVRTAAVAMAVQTGLSVLSAILAWTRAPDPRIPLSASTLASMSLAGAMLSGALTWMLFSGYRGLSAPSDPQLQELEGALRELSLYWIWTAVGVVVALLLVVVVAVLLAAA